MIFIVIRQTTDWGDERAVRSQLPVLVDREGESCVRGCYRCLLSYFNQPDHELIDRASDETKQLLVDLARGKVLPPKKPVTSGKTARWESAFKDAGIPEPDAATVTFADQEMPFVWRSHFVAASVSPLISAAREIAEAKGWTLFELPESPAAGVSASLASMFKD